MFRPVCEGETTCAPARMRSLRAVMVLQSAKGGEPRGAGPVRTRSRKSAPAAAICATRRPAQKFQWASGVEQEVWALLVTYQALRTAVADAAATVRGADPDRASFTIALNAARDQVILAAGVIARPRRRPRRGHRPPRPGPPHARPAAADQRPRR